MAMKKNARRTTKTAAKGSNGGATRPRRKRTAKRTATGNRSKAKKKATASEGGSRKPSKKARASTGRKRTKKASVGRGRPRGSSSRGAKRGGRQYDPRAGEKVAEVMHERKAGKLRSGRSKKKVTSRKQAVAIGLSEARREGARVPRPR